MKSLYLISLFALFGCSRSQPLATKAPSHPPEPPQAAQTPPAAAQSNRAIRVDPLAMAMQNAVLRKQDLTEIKQILKAGFKIDDPIGCGTFNCVDGAVAVHNMKLLNFFLASGAKPKGSALFQAVWCKDPDVSSRMVQTLLKAGADPNYKSQGLTALGSASYLGHVAVVEVLLSQPGIEFNTLDTDHRTPLMWAAEKGNEKIVRLLLEKGADRGITVPLDIRSVENIQGKAAVDFARTDAIRNLIDGYKNTPAIATAGAPPAQ